MNLSWTRFLTQPLRETETIRGFSYPKERDRGHVLPAYSTDVESFNCDTNKNNVQFSFPKSFCFWPLTEENIKIKASKAANRGAASSPSPSSLGRCKFLCRRADHRRCPADSTAGPDGWCTERSPWSLQHTNSRQLRIQRPTHMPSLVHSNS